jgi:hypothetical protein
VPPASDTAEQKEEAMSSVYQHQINDAAPNQLTIPASIQFMTNVLEAAIAYAESGWYVIPVKAGTKNPGSILGKNWPDKSTRAPETILRYFRKNDVGIALDAGKSGAIIFDVDNPQHLPPILRKHLFSNNVPFQATRICGPQDRGHCFFQVPTGMRLGNGLGKLNTGWGDIRCNNGVVLAAPSSHPSPEGFYHFIRTGPLPTLPSELVTQLPKFQNRATKSISSEDASTFVDDNSREIYREILLKREQWVLKNPPIPGTRHYFFAGFLVLVLKDARAGFCTANDAISLAERLFNSCKHFEEQKPNEFLNLVIWAIEKVYSMDPFELAVHFYQNAPHLENVILKEVR